jgi:hypothetical protein
MKRWAIILLLSAAAVITVVSVVWAQTQANKWRDAALRTDSITAAADTARQLEIAALGDTVTVYQRRIVQVELERDEVERELGERPVVRLPGEVVLDTIYLKADTVYAGEESTDSLQTYDFSGEDYPFGYSGNAEIFPYRYSGNFRVSVFQTDPVGISARVTCRPVEGGVDAASVTFIAEDPFRIIPGQVMQDPGICNPEPVGFSLLPELSFKGIGWELLKGAGWMLLANQLDDGVRKAYY